MQDSLTQTEREESINVKHIKTMSPHIRWFFPLNPTAAPWLRHLGAGLPLWRAGFNCRPVHVMFVLDKVSIEKVFLPVPAFPCHPLFHCCSLLTHSLAYNQWYIILATDSIHTGMLSLSTTLSATWCNVLWKTVLVSSAEMGMVLKLYCTSVHKCIDCTVICN